MRDRSSPITCTAKQTGWRACLSRPLRRELHRRRADGQRAAGKPGAGDSGGTGPQTNVALLLSHPELHADIVIMGGAMGLGNWQPAAGLYYVDPQAAEMVFQSGSRWS
ncbi:MAG: nucleoside hydrolase [Escherichia coli]